MSNKKTKAKRIRKIILTVIFILINVAVIAATAINEFGNSNDAAELSEVKINWWLLLPATLCFALMILLELLKYVIMMRRTTAEGTFTRKEAFKTAWRTVMLGRYYDRITPAAVGGQPFQIYYMHKTGKVSNGLAAAIPIFGMISGQIAFLIIAIPCFIFGALENDNPALLFTAWVGLLFYAFWPVIVGGMAFFPKSTTRLIKLGVRLLAKVHIVKNKEAALLKVEKEIGDYVNCVRLILKSPKLFGGVIFLSLIANLLIAFVPYFVLTAFGGNIDFSSCLILTIAVESAVYFIPTPGNSGAAEGTFYVVFSALSSGYVFWAMLFWRLYSYYVYIFVGILIYFKMNLEKKRRGELNV